MASISDLLGKVPFLAVLPPEDRERLAAAVKRRRYARGQTILHKDEPGRSLFLIEEGSVRLYLPGMQGGDLTLAILGAGDFFGELALLDGGPRSASAVTAAETVMLTLDHEDFTTLIQSRPQSATAVLAALAKRLREADEMASDLAFLDVAGRLAKKLLELAQSRGVPRERGTLLDLPLTQEHLASMVGVTRESVNRQLAVFRRLGLVGNEGRRFVLLDPEGLRRYTG
ncbi:MAG: Crp/Fnr family transcriptional regulator [Chloroflexi bacterium]|nr:Crp/Fnr family transcriptional regulator [Chloroflexota bacterium]